MTEWKIINHERDYTFTYAGLRQVIDKYLVQDRSSGEVFETPQFMYMLISATLFAKYPKEKRMTYVKKYYDAISTYKINIPTPVMAGPSPIRQYASCVLVDVDDTLPSIFSLIWLLDVMLPKGLGSELTQEESEVSTHVSEAVRYNIRVLYLFLKNLRRLLSAVLKTSPRRISNGTLSDLAPRNRRHHCLKK